MELTELERDILTDMADDSHGVGELVGYIRSRAPTASNEVIFDRLRSLLSSWIGRGWLELGAPPRPRAGLESIGELLKWLDQQGPPVVGLGSTVLMPEVNLSNRTVDDLPWLRGTV